MWKKHFLPKSNVQRNVTWQEKIALNRNYRF